MSDELSKLVASFRGSDEDVMKKHIATNMYMSRAVLWLNEVFKTKKEIKAKDLIVALDCHPQTAVYTFDILCNAHVLQKHRVKRYVFYTPVYDKNKLILSRYIELSNRYLAYWNQRMGR